MKLASFQQLRGALVFLGKSNESQFKPVFLMCMAPINKSFPQKNEQGFALLMTLIVVTVVVAIGLTVLDLSTKQIRLSTNAKDSEVAFHAANAGMECARYWRRTAANAMENGMMVPNVRCFGAPQINVPAQEVTSGVTGDGEVFLYDYSFTWAADSRCSQITTLVASSTALGSGLTIGNMTTLVPGYPTGSSKTCAAGERCTVLSVRGYNKPCSPNFGYGTVQREVLLQF
jgi:Tfp pilus assembly protein PilX